MATNVQYQTAPGHMNSYKRRATNVQYQTAPGRNMNSYKRRATNVHYQTAPGRMNSYKRRATNVQYQTAPGRKNSYKRRATNVHYQTASGRMNSYKRRATNVHYQTAPGHTNSRTHNAIKAEYQTAPGNTHPNPASQTRVQHHSVICPRQLGCTHFGNNHLYNRRPTHKKYLTATQKLPTTGTVPSTTYNQNSANYGNPNVAHIPRYNYVHPNKSQFYNAMNSIQGLREAQSNNYPNCSSIPTVPPLHYIRHYTSYASSAMRIHPKTYQPPLIRNLPNQPPRNRECVILTSRIRSQKAPLCAYQNST
eukprot:682908_1